MTAEELKRKYIDFFIRHNHKEINGASLIPENDPTVLFTTAGMHPLVPYFLGEPHPEGKRLVNVQKCVRTDDIDEVGDETHLTFFEMLGNWSLGDYFKKEAIELSYKFLTEELGIDPNRLWVSVFEGDDDAPRDEESAEVWQKAGIPKERIFYLNKKENWWGPAGQTGPCGPCTEMFFEQNREKCDDPQCGPGCECGKFVEIWNDVFLQFNKTADGTFEPLSQKCVDTGLGVERVATVLQGKDSVFETELFAHSITKIHELAEIKDERAVRIIADHIRSATFIMADKIMPSNTDQGYIVRRLLRRLIRTGRKIGIKGSFTSTLATLVIQNYSNQYPELKREEEAIIKEMHQEEERFSKTLQHGEREFHKIAEQMRMHNQKEISGRLAFKLYDTYGFPIEMTEELAAENHLTVDRKGFDAAFEKHQALSRVGAEAKFKGGLADDSEQTTKLHTATHLLHTALRQVLGDHVEQRGSNITTERLRFDFSHPEKMTDEEKKQVEDIVNEQIKKELPISFEEMTVEEAKSAGAIGLFESKYGERVKVYSVGDFSKEICGGPHIKNTRDLGSFSIKKEQASSAGVRRIKAVVG